MDSVGIEYALFTPRFFRVYYSRVRITHQVHNSSGQDFLFAKFRPKSEKLAKFGLAHQARKFMA